MRLITKHSPPSMADIPVNAINGPYPLPNPPFASPFHTCTSLPLMSATLNGPPITLPTPLPNSKNAKTNPASALPPLLI